MVRTARALPHLDGALRWLHLQGVVPTEVLERVHDAGFVRAFLDGTLDATAVRRIGLPHSPQLVRRTLLEVEGTRVAAQTALSEGLACNCGGGTHHSFHDHGSGFTIFNDLAVTARDLVHSGAARKVVVFDLDVHQGDGTAKIFEHDPQGN
ncbi:hypothetical protein T484DRAFT_1832024 [Baffinella frigidus]|nr:hypothetical protein T484DRAFT_1832024 [Cryptophyta sp. CCMP2293]